MILGLKSVSFASYALVINLPLIYNFATLIYFEILAGKKWGFIHFYLNQTKTSATERATPPRKERSVAISYAQKRQSLPFFMYYKVAIVNSCVTVFELDNMFPLHVQEKALPLTGWWGDKIWNFTFFLFFTIA